MRAARAAIPATPATWADHSKRAAAPVEGEAAAAADEAAVGAREVMMVELALATGLLEAVTMGATGAVVGAATVVAGAVTWGWPSEATETGAAEETTGAALVTGATVVAGAVTCGWPSLATETGAGGVVAATGAAEEAGGACGWPSPICETGVPVATTTPAMARSWRASMVMGGEKLVIKRV